MIHMASGIPYDTGEICRFVLFHLCIHYLCGSHKKNKIKILVTFFVPLFVQLQSNEGIKMGNSKTKGSSPHEIFKSWTR